MGNFSRDTFDRLKHYVSVRLQQGVPLVDADWNEGEDIRRYELQAFLKWFVGDGVPMGDKGFAIGMLAVDNDFEIHAGRCLVEGQDAINEGNLAYSDQVLSDPAIAKALGVAPVLPLGKIAVKEGDYTAYLDVWEREVLPGEIGDDSYVYDRNLINEDIGLPTCTRTKREWVVRVVQGLGPPTPATGHVHYPLARIARRAGDPRIYADDIIDLRRTGLKIGSYYDTQQIVRDAFGDSYTLDGDGEPDLKISLRETINALLRGAIPMTPAAQFSLEAAYEQNPYPVLDSRGDTWVFWQSTRSGNNDIWCRRCHRASGTWGPDTQITTDTAVDYQPNAVTGADGTLWVFWVSNRSGNYDIWCNHRSVDGDWLMPEAVSTGKESDSNQVALVDGAGQVWVFWESYRGGNANIYCNRRPVGGSWAGEAALTTDAGSDTNPSVLVDEQGRPMVFWVSSRDTNNDLYYRYYDPVDGWSPDTRLTSDTGDDNAPFAVRDAQGAVWVFWESTRSGNQDIWCKRGRLIDIRGSVYWRWDPDTQVTTDASSDSIPVAVADAQGDLWLFWRSNRGGIIEVWYKRYSGDGGWNRDRPMVTDYGTSNYNTNKVAIQAALDCDGDIRVFWSVMTLLTPDIIDVKTWHSKFIPQI